MIVLGPVVSEYGEQATDAHGTAELSVSVAARLTWASLCADEAWACSGQVYLRDT